jgi:hypothetical protein
MPKFAIRLVEELKFPHKFNQKKMYYDLKKRHPQLSQRAYIISLNVGFSGDLL